MKTAILAAAALVVLSAGASAQSISGTYRVSGMNFNGSKYSGTAEITYTSNTSCRIHWVTGKTTSRGICMRYGPSFAASYRLQTAVGLVMYEIKEDGTLDGIWT